MAKLSPEQAAQLADAQRRLRDSGIGGGTADKLTDTLVLDQRVQNGVQHYDRFGTGTWDDAVGAYRQRGEALQGRAAPVLDQTQANQARGLQMGSLGMLRAQADGSAPSSSAILSQRANQDAAMQAGSAVAGVKGGPGAHIAALRGAGATAAGQAMASNVNVANQRAGEISRGQGQYAGGANDLRGQDVNAATTQAQLQAQQNQLNEAGQQTYEGLGYNTRAAQQGTAMEAQQQQNDDVAELKRVRAGEQQRKMDDAVTAGKAFSTFATGAMSDMRTKMHIGSLGRLMRGGQ